MKNVRLSKAVCEAHCRYYKPAIKEELACMCYIISERLLEKGRFDLSMLQTGTPPKDSASRVPGRTASEALSNTICGHCDFSEEDCDYSEYRRSAPTPDSGKGPWPCGGLIFLGLLMESGRMDITDINQVI